MEIERNNFDDQKWEPAHWMYTASYKNPRNVKLARAIYKHLTWTSYDRHAAHRWAMKFIQHDPKSAYDAYICLLNFNWMEERAKEAWERTMPPAKKKSYEKAFEAYTQWKAAVAASPTT